MRTMGSRSNPIAALETLSWHLNYHVGETLPVNQVARSTGLAWATVQKYVQVIETIQNIAPRVSYGSEGIQVGNRTKVMREATTDTATSIALYLFVHAKETEGPGSPLEVSEHADVLANVSDTLEEMESLGWIEVSGDTIQLTPLGIQIAGPIYSNIQNGIEDHDVVRVDRDGQEVRAVIESSSEKIGSIVASAEDPAVQASQPKTRGTGDFVKNDYTEQLYA